MALVSHSGFRTDVVAQFFVVTVVDDVAEVVHDGPVLSVSISLKPRAAQTPLKVEERDARLGAGEQFITGGFPIAIEWHTHLFQFGRLFGDDLFQLGDADHLACGWVRDEAVHFVKADDHVAVLLFEDGFVNACDDARLICSAWRR
jgi:hypothetical protein